MMNDDQAEDGISNESGTHMCLSVSNRERGRKHRGGLEIEEEREREGREG